MNGFRRRGNNSPMELFYPFIVWVSMRDENISTSVFLADDDEDDCMLFRDALNEVAGHVSLTVLSNGEALMNILERDSASRPGVIFLDLNMPRKNGFECLKEIKQSDHLKHIPVVIFSTSSQKESVQKAFSEGANRYICKPVNFHLLKKTIHKVLSINWKDGSAIAFKDFLLRP